jgi:hypothetical protein
MAAPRRWKLLPVLAMPGLLGACGVFFGGSTAAERADAAAARLLTDLVDAVTGTVDRSGQEIASASQDTAVERLSVYYRMRLSRAARTTLGYRDPHVGLMDLWTLCVQVEQYLTEGDGAGIFGPHQALAVDAAQHNRARVAELARTAFDAKEVEAAEGDVVEFARRYPMRETFSRVGLRASDVGLEESQGGAASTLRRTLSFEWINPLSGFGSDVTESAEAVGAAMDRFTLAAEYLPRQLGWQLELFVCDLEDSEGLQQVHDGVAGAVTAAERMPRLVREELTSALGELGPVLAQVRTVLAEARETATPVGAVGASFADTARQIDRMAQGLTAALEKFDATYRLLTTREEVGYGDEPAREAKARPFDILEWNQTARSIQQMSAELRSTLDEFQRTVDDPELDDALHEAKGVARGTVAVAALWLVLGGAVLIGLLLLAAWCVRLILSHRARRSASADSA